MAGEDSAQRWMRRALALAERGRGGVSPNPMVGCVLVRDGVVVGEGWHARAGEPHAEALALRAAGADARGSTAYVTLEPCAHHGRTPPCAAALIDAGVARVVVAMADPNPEAAGGAERLRAAGIEVETGVLEDEARRLNEVFLHGVRSGRPFVVVKTAVSLDGRIAAADGSSRWLTSLPARRRAHLLRAEVDAIVVGSGTVLADDPQLTVRLDGPDLAVPAGGGARTPVRQPLRVVLDARGRVRPPRRVLDDAAPTLVLTAAAEAGEALAATHADVAVLPSAAGGGLDPARVLAALWDRDVRSVLVEGGAEVATSFVRAGLADRLLVHVAPLVLGEEGRPAFVGPWAASIEDAPRFRLDDVERVGEDALLALSPRPEAGGQPPARRSG